ncbi:universal stress protein [Caenimonas terrae]|uniref:Universal stress protein n=1 Tax=Caenimonas terrae TaxID=696074 RepID=A0ABW0NIK2_9BURK
MYQRILVPTDGSELSGKAVRTAITLAARLGSELVALYVAPRYPVSFFDGDIGLPREEVARTEKEWADKGQAAVDAVAAAARVAGVQARAVVMQSDLVADSILAAAKKNECDLVVMASHGRKGVARVLLGSETQHVLTHGEVPVLVLR